MAHLMFITDAGQLANEVTGTWNLTLVLISYLMVLIATYAALALGRRASRSRHDKTQWGWDAASGIALGCGIWAMHFIGMLAFTLPVAVDYDIFTTLISIVPAILASGIVLYMLRAKGSGPGAILGGGIVFGAGIGLMHYTGMAAMQTSATMLYAPYVFGASMVVAVLLSSAALAVKSRTAGLNKFSHRIISAATIGAAVSGIHYTAMAGVHFIRPDRTDATIMSGNTTVLTIEVAAGIIAIMALTLAAVIVDKRLELADSVARSSRVQLLEAIESISEGFFLFNAEGHLTLCNDVARGFIPKGQKEDLIDRHYRDLFPDDARLFLDDGLVHSDDQTSWTYEKELPSGRWAHVSEHRTASGGGVCVWSDITRSKRYASEMKASESRLRTVVDTALDCMIVIDHRGRITDFNPAAESCFGYSREEVIGLEMTDLFVPETSREVCWRGRQNFLLTGESDVLGVRKEIKALRRDGTEFPAELARASAQGQDGPIFIGFLRDITEEKQRERALEESEGRLRAVIDNAPLMIAVKDRQGRYSLMNNHGTSMIRPDLANEGGNTEAFCVGKTAREIFPADIAAESEQEDRRVLSEQGMIEVTRVLRDSGQMRYNKVIKFPIKRGNGEVTGLGEIVSDISDQIRLEEHLRENEKMSALGQLAGGVAHDFNNILMIIGGHSRMALRDQGLPEKVRDALTGITNAADKAAGLTRQLLAFGRGHNLATKVIRVPVLFEELEILLKPLLGETIDLKVRVLDKRARIETDPDLLMQCLINLAINARDASPGGGAIRISADVVTPNENVMARNPDAVGDRFVDISVADKGTGIDAITMTRIFEPFFTTKEQGKGTGLGLAMSYGFVTQSKGMIDVETEVGKGTTFHVYLPLCLADESTLAVIEDDGGKYCSSGQETVLLAEDNDEIRNLLASILEDLGYEVIAAADGFEALEVEADFDGEIDLLLSDIVMPNLDGIGLSRAIRQAHPHMNVLFISGHPSRDDSQQVEIPEGATLLHKPITPVALAKAVRIAIDSGKVSAEAVVIN